MGILYCYCCLDCKRYIEMNKYSLDLTNSCNDSVSWDKVSEFEKWLDGGEKFFAQTYDEYRILDWFKQHQNHNIIHINDVISDTPFLDEYCEIVPGWKVQTHEDGKGWMDWDKMFISRLAYDWMSYGSWTNAEQFEEHVDDKIDREVPCEFGAEARWLWNTNRDLFLRTERNSEACCELAKTLIARI